MVIPNQQGALVLYSLEHCNQESSRCQICCHWWHRWSWLCHHHVEIKFSVSSLTSFIWFVFLFPWAYAILKLLSMTKSLTFDLSWWRHQMKTFSALLAICAGNSPVPGEFPTQRPVTRSFDVYFDLRPNKRLSKQSWGWWFETLSCSLWRHRNIEINHNWMDTSGAVSLMSTLPFLWRRQLTADISPSVTFLRILSSQQT